jgi:hypothetical protein
MGDPASAAALQALALPVDVVAAIDPVEHPRQHEHQVGQAVQVLARRVLERLFIAQGHHGALGAARHGAAHMGLGGAAPAGGQDELLQARQLGVVARQRLVQLQHRLGLEQLEARDRQLAAQVEQLVLDVGQQLAHRLGQGLAQQQADVRVELVHIAHGVHAQAVLGHAGVVAQAGGAVVSGAGGDLGQAVGHAGVLANIGKGDEKGGLDRLSGPDFARDRPALPLRRAVNPGLGEAAHTP